MKKQRNHEKNILKVAVVAAVAFVAGYATYNAQKTEVVSDLVMENVEALATGEVIVGPWYCVGEDNTCISDSHGTIKGEKHYI